MENNVNGVTEQPADEAVGSDVLLEVKNLKKYFPVEKNFFGKPVKFLKAVDGISFTLRKGKTLGIVGESGCGKSTMGRSLLRLYDGVEGEILFNGQDVAKLKNREFDKLRPNLQMIFQDPYASLSPRLTVGEIIGESARQHGLVNRAGFHEYVLNVMKMCGLQPHYFERYPHEFSGGQRQRICIARALALKPSLVVCDEPVSALDVSIQAQVINMLIELREKLGLTYIFISHDLSVVKHISDDVGVMYLGNIVEYGSKDRVFNNTLHPYTKALFSAVPVPNPHVKMKRIMLKGDIPSPVNPPKGCKFHTRCEHCSEICSRIAPEYREVEEGHFCACHLYNSEEDTQRLLAQAEINEQEEKARAEKEAKLPWNIVKNKLIAAKDKTFNWFKNLFKGKNKSGEEVSSVQAETQEKVETAPVVEEKIAEEAVTVQGVVAEEKKEKQVKPTEKVVKVEEKPAHVEETVIDTPVQEAENVSVEETPVEEIKAETPAPETAPAEVEQAPAEEVKAEEKPAPAEEEQKAAQAPEKKKSSASGGAKKTASTTGGQTKKAATGSTTKKTASTANSNAKKTSSTSGSTAKKTASTASSTTKKAASTASSSVKKTSAASGSGAKKKTQTVKKDNVEKE